MTSDPLGGRVDDNIYPVIEGSAKEAASAEGVVDLYISKGYLPKKSMTVSQSLERRRHGLLATAPPSLVQ